ncbi:SDR family NAD(P)-dependent oxidoreductase [Pseudorhodoplanes sp.]|uniref:SDR family NAD(P)-dependent oxidoreductase n=1 Tax=Pseudorhodoplanes sp. TaxID=1934341 RepID=UPI002BB824BA|nr:SDR family NAD(P)-dependent oxidoreductase [Pseudorhodoplanes sp.]HWV55799.1 SDR family NAD(P)-dependent oxidoreductase [Pseudorhodoplanes sp.]
MKKTDALDGCVAMVTGCGGKRGIGAAIVRALAADGAKVVATDIARNRDALAEVCAEINRELGEELVFPEVCDITSMDSCKAAVDSAVGRFGRLDILVNNAGAPQGADRADLSEVSEEAWTFVVDVNLNGAFRVTKHALPHLRASGRGRIISISSAAAIRSLFDRVAYAASKAGILGMTVSLAGDVADSGITVNAICPGSVDSGRDTVRPDASKSGPVYAWSPVGRVGVPADIAGLVKYLASDSASYLTGQAITIDGGLSTVLKL